MRFFSLFLLKQLNIGLKIKLNGKKTYETDSIKYLGIQTGKHLLAWKQQIKHMTKN